jgi:hypothetical protein
VKPALLFQMHYRISDVTLAGDAPTFPAFFFCLCAVIHLFVPGFNLIISVIEW